MSKIKISYKQLEKNGGIVTLKKPASRVKIGVVISREDLKGAFRRSESKILNSICAYLRARRYFFWRQNNNAVYDRTKSIFRKFSQYAMPGVPDILLYDKPRTGGYFTLYAIEVKSATGNLSKYQKEFEMKWVDRGGIYVVARSLDDVIRRGL